MHPRILARRMAVGSPALHDLDVRIVEAVRAMRAAAKSLAADHEIREFARMEIWLECLEREIAGNPVATPRGLWIRRQALLELQLVQTELARIVADLERVSPSGDRTPN